MAEFYSSLSCEKVLLIWGQRMFELRKVASVDHFDSEKPLKWAYSQSVNLHTDAKIYTRFQF